VIAAARGGGGDAHHAMDDVTRETVRAMIASALTPITLRLDAVDRALATTMRSIERIEYVLYGDQRVDASGLAQRINHIEQQLDDVINRIDAFSSTMRGAKAAFAALAAAMTALSAPNVIAALAQMFGAQ
jgi:D-ribose pyranose/furanose isomerase RbsD